MGMLLGESYRVGMRVQLQYELLCFSFSLG